MGCDLRDQAINTLRIPAQSCGTGGQARQVDVAIRQNRRHRRALLLAVPQLSGRARFTAGEHLLMTMLRECAAAQRNLVKAPADGDKEAVANKQRIRSIWERRAPATGGKA